MLCTKFLKTSYIPTNFLPPRHFTNDMDHSVNLKTEEVFLSETSGKPWLFWRCKTKIIWTETVVNTWKSKYYVVLNLKYQTMSFIFRALPITFLVLSEFIWLVLYWALSHFCTTFLYDWHSLDNTFYGRL